RRRGCVPFTQGVVMMNELQKVNASGIEAWPKCRAADLLLFVAPNVRIKARFFVDGGGRDGDAGCIVRLATTMIDPCIRNKGPSSAQSAGPSGLSDPVACHYPDRPHSRRWFGSTASGLITS